MQGEGGKGVLGYVLPNPSAREKRYFFQAEPNGVLFPCCAFHFLFLWNTIVFPSWEQRRNVPSQMNGRPAKRIHLHFDCSDNQLLSRPLSRDVSVKSRASPLE